MSENISDPEESDSCTEEEEVEPKLKYVRLKNDLQNNILSKDAVSCIAVHSKFLCLGTHWGAVYLLDHQGNTVTLDHQSGGSDNGSNTALDKKHFQCHMVSVNAISIDQKGEFIATCSDDGTVIVKGLYTDENNPKLNQGQNVKSIALDPMYYKPGSGRRFIVGDRNLTLYEKTFLKGLKTTLLSTAEGNVSNITWKDQWIAWSSHIGVRVYDLNEKSSLGLIKWEEPKSAPLSNFRCNLRWLHSSSPATLLIGWCDTVRICFIRKRSVSEFTSRNMPGYIVDPVSTFQTDFFICGLAPFRESNQLVVLGYPKERDSETDKAMRPILSVLQYQATDYIEICTDSLSIRGYQEYKCNDYHLDCWVEENQYFIVSPKDIVVASQCDQDDRVEWLLNHEKFEKALDVISISSGKYSLISVARLYLDHLLANKQYTEAAKLCHRAFGNDKQLWGDEIYKFKIAKQLRVVSAYIPRTEECKLSPQVYEMVLNEYLLFDPVGLLDLIKEWQPTLYNKSVIINAIQNFILHDKESNARIKTLQEALAILYSYEKKYDKALEMYLNLQHKDVFVLIKNHNLYASIKKVIKKLITLDREKAVAMLVEKDKISSDTVVKELRNYPEYLYYYLDAFDKVDNEGKYSRELVNLYAQFAPQKLLKFLKRSTTYPMAEALEICKRKLFYPEMVYLLGKMGNTDEALAVIINKLNNVDMAIEFCKENDDLELWKHLIDKSLNKAEFMTKVLDGIVGFINPVIVIDKIEKGQEIPGLKTSIIKMLSEYSLQVSIQEGCNEILVTDYFNLHEKLVQNQRKALYVSNDIVCEMCARDIIIKDPLKTNIVAFNCHHFFHETCLPDKYDQDYCAVCRSKQAQN